MQESRRKARRRAKLDALLQEVGGAAQAEIDTGTPRTHFVAMIKGRRGLGDELAAKLETAYGKPPGWFDQEIAWPFSAELQQRALTLSGDELRKAENVLRAHLDMPQIPASTVTSVKHIGIVKDTPDGHHHDPEVVVGAIEREAISPRSTHEGQVNSRSAHRKSGGGA